ncbi:hypothetical protein HR12_46730, partial [Microbacterium sp. SUBG005]
MLRPLYPPRHQPHGRDTPIAHRTPLGGATNENLAAEAATSRSGATLARTLGLWSIVGLGLGYMTPTVVFDTFGLVADKTNNVVPAAYAVALVVLVFTAISYGKMVRVIPSAGSAYTYARESIHPARLRRLDGAHRLHAVADGERPHPAQLHGG